ncbi:ATP-binding protein [Streptomyces sp. OF3]|uniref:ATP-binding protein n=1 Tax=Streptomyces alkaliterrae TaxID=2213162 RepID=A0A7W3ZN04_9ACTN|nr:ATP-binding protein [Streptomyces alkaliterrae]
MALVRQRRFPRRRTAVRAAREFVGEVLAEWQSVDRLDDVRLCVSELATNAVLHGVPAGREFCVRVVREGGVVRLEVRDSGDGLPEVRAVDDRAESGRGLPLALGLADRGGVVEHVVGKSVWLVFEGKVE